MYTKYVTMIIISPFLAVITYVDYTRVTLHVITSVDFFEISTLCVISYTVFLFSILGILLRSSRDQARGD